MRLLALVFAFSIAVGVSAEPVSLGDSVTFDPPTGFTPLSADEIAFKYPSARAPRFVVGNKRRSTTIAYDLKPDAIPPDKLEEVSQSLQQTLQRLIPGLIWKERKIIELSGRKWIYLELMSNAVDTDIHNIMLVTPFQGQMLLFNFNSTKEEFPKVEKALRRSLQSISAR
jgi:hypothetical protein